MHSKYFDACLLSENSAVNQHQATKNSGEIIFGFMAFGFPVDYLAHVVGDRPFVCNLFNVDLGKNEWLSQSYPHNMRL